MKKRALWISIIRHAISGTFAMLCAMSVYFLCRLLFESPWFAVLFTAAFIFQVVTDGRVWALVKPDRKESR